VWCSQWNTAFSTNTNVHSPPSATTDSSQSSEHMVAVHHGLQYADATKLMPMSAQQQPLPQPYNPHQQIIINNARDWQQSVASVFDPHGLKRTWDGTSPPAMPNLNR
jgi:hypothetical protein